MAPPSVNPPSPAGAGKGRERRVGLSPDRIITAALEIADREGLDAVTLRRLAEALDVHPTSLYGHLPNKDAILDGMIDALIAEMVLPEHFPDWPTWLRSFAAALKDLARRHPGAFLVLTRRPAIGPVARRQTEAALDAFARDGFGPLPAAQAVGGCALALLGLALNECPPVDFWGGPGPISLGPEVAAEDFPHTAAATQAWTELAGEWVGPGLDPGTDPVWEMTVTSLIGGLKLRPRDQS